MDDNTIKIVIGVFVFICVITAVVLIFMFNSDTDDDSTSDDDDVVDDVVDTDDDSDDVVDTDDDSDDVVDTDDDSDKKRKCNKKLATGVDNCKKLDSKKCNNRYVRNKKREGQNCSVKNGKCIDEENQTCILPPKKKKCNKKLVTGVDNCKKLDSKKCKNRYIIDGNDEGQNCHVKNDKCVDEENQTCKLPARIYRPAQRGQRGRHDWRRGRQDYEGFDPIESYVNF